ncbi:MAG: hypothetical protein CMP65_00150 [Flavobacteriales bacterium]|nr:hypothetical protein [Flavobacteriales bacterium]
MNRIFLVFVLFFNFSFSQDLNSSLYQGMDYFYNKDYNLSRSYFQSIIDNNSHLLEEAYYYYYLSSLKLYHSDTEKIYQDFLTKFPHSSKRLWATFYMSEFLFEKKKFKEVTSLLIESSIYQLDHPYKDKAFFYLAYSAFENNKLDLAKSSFYELFNSKNTLYKELSVFYHSIILLHEGELLDALSGFKSLQGSHNVKNEIQYYISKILFDLGDYSQVVNHLDSSLIDTLSNYQDMLLIYAKSLYNLKKYDPAIVYFEEYKILADTLYKSDLYQIGYSYYKKGLFGFAINHLNKITLTEKDSITQYGFYFLGDSYKRTNNHLEAMNAFRSASLIESDSLIQHDAFYQFVRLCYEHDHPLYNPIHYLNEFLDLYPDSKYKDEIYTCLANIHLITHNYDHAISVLEKSGFNDKSVKEQYQKICFYRAVQLFNDGFYKDAIIYFDKSIDVGNVSDLINKCFYWKGEAYYKMNEYLNAVLSFTQISQSSQLYNQSLYSLGYCYFELKDYVNAINSFKYSIVQNQNAEISHDTYARIGDCYFLLKNFQLATQFYSKSLDQSGEQNDYCAYKKSVSFSLLKDYDNAIQSIKYIFEKFPNSNFVDEAMFDLGNIYIQTRNLDLATNTFLSIINNFPQSLYFSYSKLKLGLVYHLKGEDVLAIDVLEQLISNSPSSNVYEQALSTIKNIYTEIGKVDKFLELIKNIDHDYTKSELDSSTYYSAELQYMQANYDNAIESLQSYLLYYPAGIFSLQANYYLFKSFEKNGNQQDAIEVLKHIVNQEENRYTVESLASLAQMSFELENYISSESYYKKLIDLASTVNLKQEAIIGFVESKFALYKYAEIVNYIDNSFNESFFSGEKKVRMNYLFAYSLYKTDLNLRSIEKFKWISENSGGKLKAESLYFSALIHYNLQNYKDSQKCIFELINLLPGYTNWVDKSLLLLSKNYIQEKDMFQAQHVLNELKKKSNNSLIMNEIDLLLNNYPDLKMDLINQ